MADGCLLSSVPPCVPCLTGLFASCHPEASHIVMFVGLPEHDPLSFLLSADLTCLLLPCADDRRRAPTAIRLTDIHRRIDSFFVISNT